MSKVELKKKWWLANRPKNVKGVELEKVLGLIEQATDDKLLAALAGLAAAIAKANAELDKKLHKDLLKDLEGLGDLGDAEKKKAQAAAAKAEAAAKAAAKAEAEAAAKAKADAAAKAKETAKAAPGGARAAADDPAEDNKLLDPEHQRTVLKQALNHAVVFAFSVSNKPESRILALAPRGNPAALGRLVKGRSEGVKVCFGTAQAAETDSAKLLLTLESAMVGGLAKGLAAYFKQHKLTVFRKVGVVVDGKEDDSERSEEGPADLAARPDESASGGAAAAMAEAAEGAPDAVRPASAAETEDGPVADAPAAASARDESTVPEEAAPSADGASTQAAQPPGAADAASEAPKTPAEMEVLDDRRREFKRARAAWVRAKARAEEDLEKVKDGAHRAYLADSAQFPKVVAGCKAIDDILDNLDNDLRDTLDQYASTPLRKQQRLHELAGQAIDVLERYQKYVAGNALLKAIDLKEFADVQVHAPITQALNDLRKALT